jgi:hypothetical protein
MYGTYSDPDWEPEKWDYKGFPREDDDNEITPFFPDEDDECE